MPSVYINFTCSLSILFAGFISVVRFNKINGIYFPVILCIWIASINELLSAVLYKFNCNSSLNNNIYMLCESILIPLQFKYLGLLRKPKYLFRFLSISFLLIWAIDNFFISSIFRFNVYFSILYSFIIILLSLSCMSRLIGTSGKNIRNSTFLLCLGFILYFTVTVLVYSFYLYGLGINQPFLLRVYAITIYVNLLTNLIYALAVLWMPKKIPFLLPF